MTSILGTIWRHKKRGTEYHIILTSCMQSAIPDMDNKSVISYRCMQSGKVYTRTYDEFMDGRFERV